MYNTSMNKTIETQIADIAAKFNMSKDDAENVAQSINDGIEMRDDVWDTVYNFYIENGEMPYGTAKARDGDPYEWIGDTLEKELGIK